MLTKQLAQALCLSATEQRGVRLMTDHLLRDMKRARSTSFAGRQTAWPLSVRSGRESTLIKGAGLDISRTSEDQQAAAVSAMTRNRLMVAGLESRYPVQDWIVGGISVWPALKAQLLLSANVADLARTGTGRDPHAGLAGRMRAQLASSIAANRAVMRSGRQVVPDFANESPLLISVAGSSFRPFENAMSHPLASPLLAAAQAEGVSVSVLCHDGVLPDATTPRAPQWEALARSGNLGTVNANRWYSSSVVVDTVDAVRKLPGLQEAISEFGSRLTGIALSVRRLRALAWRIAQSGDCYDRILDRVNPRAVMVQNHYGMAGWGLCIAARRRGILVFDIQHGIQGPAHEAYTFPRGADEGAAPLPNGYFCWDEVSAAHLRTWVARPDLVFAGTPLPLLDRLHVLERSEPPMEAGPRTLLYLATRGENPAAFLDLAAKVADKTRLIWCGHPLSPEAPGLPAEVAVGSLLGDAGNTNGAITGFSSAALEARALGLPVLVHGAYGRELLRPVLGDAGMLYGSLDRESVARLAQMPRDAFVPDTLRQAFQNAWRSFLTRTGLKILGG